MTDVTPPADPPGPSGQPTESSGEPTGSSGELTPEELACGYLDGELAPDDRARVETDPELMALVTRLGAVSKAVAAPVGPLGEDRRAAMLAAALAAAPPAGATLGAAGSGVVSLDQARAKRSGRAVRVVAGALAAAAAVGLVALFVARDSGGGEVDTAGRASADTVATLEAAAEGGGEVTDAATSENTAENAPADTAAADADTAVAPASEAPAGGQDSSSSPLPAATTAAAAGASALPDLGSLPDRQAARTATSDFAFVVVPPDPGDGPCAGYPPPVATATFQGAPAYVVIIEAEPSGNRLAFLDQLTCAVLVKVDPANG